MPTKDVNGVDTYDNSNYSAPVQAVIGMAGFTLDNFTTDVSSSSSLSLSLSLSAYLYSIEKCYTLLNAHSLT
jgi:hypothetical protein